MPSYSFDDYELIKRNNADKLLKTIDLFYDDLVFDLYFDKLDKVSMHKDLLKHFKMEKRQMAFDKFMEEPRLPPLDQTHMKLLLAQFMIIFVSMFFYHLFVM